MARGRSDDSTWSELALGKAEKAPRIDLVDAALLVVARRRRAANHRFGARLARRERMVGAERHAIGAHGATWTAVPQ